MTTLTFIFIAVLICTIFYFIIKRAKENNSSNSTQPIDNATPPEDSILCDLYLNNTGSPLSGINYVDCSGAALVNQIVEPNQSINVKRGTLNGGDSGYLINLD